MSTIEDAIGLIFGLTGRITSQTDLLVKAVHFHLDHFDHAPGDIDRDFIDAAKAQIFEVIREDIPYDRLFNHPPGGPITLSTLGDAIGRLEGWTLATETDEAPTGSIIADRTYWEHPEPPYGTPVFFNDDAAVEYVRTRKR
jgi:hypothetical protein